MTIIIDSVKMRLLVETVGEVRIFKDRSLFGLPRWVIEHYAVDTGDRYTKILSGIWYKEKDAINIAKQINERWI